MSDTQTAPMRPAHDPTGRRRMAGPSAGPRIALLAAVAHAAEVLTATPDLPQALVEAGRVLGEATGVDRVNVMRYDHEAQAGFLYAEWARAGVTPLSQVDPGPYRHAEYAEVWRPLLAGEVYHSPLPEKTGANAALNAASAVRTDLFVPVFVEGHFWGTLNFDDCTTERAWTDGEIDVLRTAAAAVAAAVRREGLERERARAAEVRAAEMARRNALLAIAADASRVLIDAVDVGAACDRVLAMLGPALDADRAALGVLTPSADGGAPWCELTHEWTAPGVARRTDDPALRRTRLAGSDAQVAAFLAGEAFQTTIDTLAAPQRREQAAAGAHAGFALPVFVDGRAWGVLGFDDCRRARVWDAEEIGFVRIVTAALAAAVQRQRAERDRAEAVARERERAAEDRAAALATANVALREREALLAAAAEASRLLLESGDFWGTLPRALARIGQVAGWDRTALLLSQADPAGQPGHLVVAEWAA
jgi:GAF domain-containing protein